MTTFSHWHKTLILLDHGQHMLRSSKQETDFDILQKGRVSGLLPLAPVTKSMWTCSVEASLEYCRVLWDIFPHGKLIRLMVSDTSVKSLNTWSTAEQNSTQLLENLAAVGAPVKIKSTSAGSDIIDGLQQAVRALCEPTQIQHSTRTSVTEAARHVTNNGRIVCVTSLKNETHVRQLSERLLEVINEQNRQAATTDDLMPIDSVEVCVIHQTPVGEESNILGRPKRQLSDNTSLEVQVSQSGLFVAAKLIRVAQVQFSLSSTTVTGIPMKEEQNASSSANYDVELLHSSKAHDELIRSGNVDGLMTSSKDAICSETVTLKWCTPKSSSAELHYCNGSYRVTPVDVNGRPSLCLTNFLLNGRAVMLEQPRKSGGRVMSHMLASHGGEIYIHVLNIARSILEDPPSISEGAGGRVTDYRIPEFGDFLKDHRLAPSVEYDENDEVPYERAKRVIERSSRFWPMTTGESIVCCLREQVDPLPSVMVKDQLDEEDVRECERVILRLVTMETKNEQLPNITTGTRGKGPKREEQYRAMWLEMETLIRAYADTSPRHQLIMDCLLRCKKPDTDTKHIKEDPSTPVIKTESSDSSNTPDHRSSSDSKSERSIKDEGPVTKKFKPGINSFGSSFGKPGISVWDMWQNKMKALNSSRHPEFDGRLESKGAQAELYQCMKEKSESESSLSKSNNLTYTQKATVAYSLLNKDVKK